MSLSWWGVLHVLAFTSQCRVTFVNWIFLHTLESHLWQAVKKHPVKWLYQNITQMLFYCRVWAWQHCDYTAHSVSSVCRRKYFAEWVHYAHYFPLKQLVASLLLLAHLHTVLNWKLTHLPDTLWLLYHHQYLQYSFRLPGNKLCDVLVAALLTLEWFTISSQLLSRGM